MTSAVNAPQPTANFLGRTVPYKWLVAAAFVLGLFASLPLLIVAFGYGVRSAVIAAAAGALLAAAMLDE